MAFKITTVSYVLWLVVFVPAKTVLIETPFGKLEGLDMVAPNQQTYTAFRGIPYAKPPVGDLRFAKPVPLQTLDGTFDATKESVACPHPDQLLALDHIADGVEDCLVLNVYVKQLDTNHDIKKKVMVFIHGGGFVVGAANFYDPASFVTEQDVITVIINYRIGVLGFLSTENDASPGNYGLWDQAVALQWVKKNIAAFGGDPDDITIAGESAGGASVSYLSLSPHTKGLFSKVHPMSGTATSVFALSKDPQLDALAAAKSVGCWNGETDKKVSAAESSVLMECMKKCPLSNITKYNFYDMSKVRFVPCVDGDFVPLSPHHLIRDELYLESIGFFQKSYLLGVDNNERVIFKNSIKMIEDYILNLENVSQEEKSKMISDFEDATIKFYLSSRFDVTEVPEKITNKIINWYSRREVNMSLSDLTADLSFLIPTYDYLNTVAKSKSASVYFFYFNHFPDFMKGEYRGMIHGADLAFWFDLDMEQLEKMLRGGIQGDLEEDDLKMKAMFSSLIGEFVRTGNPGAALKDKLPAGWPVYDIQGSHYLDLNLNPSIRRHLQVEKRDLWFKTAPRWAAELQPDSAHTEL